MFLRTFGGAFGVTLAGLALAFLYGGGTGLAVAAILGVLEISVSFDNAVVNATYLGRLNAFWQRMFLTVGVLIAVVGMRLLFPVLIVCVTAQISPARAYHLALDGGSVHKAGTYANLLHEAHPAIAAFGGAFLLMLSLNFIFESRELTWLTWLERPLARIGKLDQATVVVVGAVLIIVARFVAPSDKMSTVLVSGIFGIIVYIVVDGLGSLFATDEDDDDQPDAAGDGPDRTGVVDGVGNIITPTGGTARVVGLAGRAAFGIFLYLEVLDATFSFDGVIGAFAITSDPVIIAIGLGIGALYIRSLTVFLVRRGALEEFVYLEHGAQWAIASLAIVLLLTIKYEVPEIVTGLIGVAFIGAAFISSVVRNRRQAANESQLDVEPTDQLIDAAKPLS
jgi:hypothetical protein